MLLELNDSLTSSHIQTEQTSELPQQEVHNFLFFHEL